MAKVTVKKGDTLSSIAKRAGTTVQAIAKANNISNVNKISAGKSLVIPAPARAPAPVYRPPAPAPKPSQPVLRPGVMQSTPVRQSTPAPSVARPTTSAPQSIIRSSVPKAVTAVKKVATQAVNTARNLPQWVNNVVSQVPANARAAAAQNIPHIAKALQNEGILTPRVLAYALATIQRETASTFRPIPEIGGRQQAIKHGYRGGPNYYGRGYIQLTHDYNYRDIGRRIGMGDALLKNPDLALDPDVAARALAAFFKDRGVAQAANRGDFFNARRGVNGLDQAGPIAQNANRYLASIGNAPITANENQQPSAMNIGYGTTRKESQPDFTNPEKRFTPTLPGSPTGLDTGESTPNPSFNSIVPQWTSQWGS